jgi:RNA polymerase-binding transcription factor DksA
LWHNTVIRWSAPRRAEDYKVHGKWSQYFEHLTRLREEFTGSKNDCSENARQKLSTSGEHMADAATDSYDRDWSLALVSSAQNALYEIDQALNRILDGSYGICELTGKPIETNRLKAIPWTRFCAEAQAQLELYGAGGRIHLGQLGSYREVAAESEAAGSEDAEEMAAAAAEK